MTKITTIYACTSCDAQSPKWAGRCLECGGWGTLVESAQEAQKKKQVISPAAIVIP